MLYYYYSYICRKLAYYATIENKRKYSNVYANNLVEKLKFNNISDNINSNSSNNNTATAWSTTGTDNTNTNNTNNDTTNNNEIKTSDNKFTISR